MGRGNGTLFSVILATLVQLAPVQAQLGSDVLKGITLPEYNDKGKLEYILYGDQARPDGIKIDVQGLTIDMVIDDLVKATGLNDTRNIKIYSIEEASKDKTIADSFWETHKKSKGIIKTPKAQYDRSSRFTRGDGLVNMRTPEMDIDGIGFDIDQNNKTAFIRSDVQILIRSTRSSNFDGSKQEGPAKDQTTMISADTAEILSLKNKVILEGNVFVDNIDLTIKCGRLIIITEDSKNKETKKRSIKKIECFSNASDVMTLISGQTQQVEITRKDPKKKVNALQKAFAGKAVYTLANGLIKLTETPSIVEKTNTIEGTKISIWRDSQKMNVIDSRVTYIDEKEQELVITSKQMDVFNSEDKVTFTQDVVALSPDYRITSDKMDVNLKETKTENSTKRQVSTIECFGAKAKEKFQSDIVVSVTRLDESGLIPEKNVQRSTSGKAIYSVDAGKLVLTEKPVLIQGLDEIAGTKITLWRDTEIMNVRNTTITYYDASQKETTVSAKQLNVLNKENRAIFTTDVIADSDDLHIEAERMELELENIKIKKKEKKQLKRIICFKNSSGDENKQSDKQVVIIRKNIARGTDDSSQEKSTSGKAVYNVQTGEIKLTDRPVIIQDSNKLTGSVITIWRDTEVVNVEDATLLLDESIQNN